MKPIERRSLTSDATVNEGKITGLAAPFNSQTMIGDAPWGFREKISPGAFTKTLNESDVVFLVNHNTDMPLARTSAGTLTLQQTERGLVYEAMPADTSYARDLAENIRAGNIQGNSFGFQVVKDHWDVGDDGVDERTVQEVKLLEVSAVTFPAYGDTEVSMRDIVNAIRDSSKPYGDVDYADPKNGKYPIDTEEHVKAAWSYINMPKNADKYPLNGVTLASVKAKIVAAAKKFGVKISEENSAPLVSIEGTDYTDMASVLISMYNALPDDLRERFIAEIRASIPDLVVKPDDVVIADQKPDVSTSDKAARSLSTYERELRVRKPRD